jgi:hypothetical protein
VSAHCHIERSLPEICDSFGWRGQCAVIRFEKEGAGKNGLAIFRSESSGLACVIRLEHAQKKPEMPRFNGLMMLAGDE